jgi:hypothetical protein
VLEITTLSSTIRSLIVIWFTTSPYYLLAKPVVLVFPLQALFNHLHYYITFTNSTTVTDRQVNRWLVLCMLPEAGIDLLEVYLASFSTNLPTTLETKLTATITIVITTPTPPPTTTTTIVYFSMVSPIPFAVKTLIVTGDGTKLATLAMLPSPHNLYKSAVACLFIDMYHNALTRSAAPTNTNNNTNDGRAPSTANATSAIGDELTLGNLLLQPLPLVPLLVLTIEFRPFTAQVTLLVIAPYHFRPFFHYLAIYRSSLLNLPVSHTSSPMQLGCSLPTTSVQYLLPFPLLLGSIQMNYVNNRCHTLQHGSSHQPLPHVPLTAPMAFIYPVSMAWLHCPFLLLSPKTPLSIIFSLPHVTVSTARHSAPSSILDGALVMLGQPRCREWKTCFPSLSPFTRFLQYITPPQYHSRYSISGACSQHVFSLRLVIPLV